MIVDESYYLAHYGVKGMKWGKRKKNIEVNSFNQKEYPNLSSSSRTGQNVSKQKAQGKGLNTTSVKSISPSSLDRSNLSVVARSGSTKRQTSSNNQKEYPNLSSSSRTGQNVSKQKAQGKGLNTKSVKSISSSSKTFAGKSVVSKLLGITKKDKKYKTGSSKR